MPLSRAIRNAVFALVAWAVLLGSAMMLSKTFKEVSRHQHYSVRAGDPI